MTNLTIRILKKPELNLVKNLQQIVTANLENQELLAPSPDDLITSSINYPNSIAGIFCEGRLIAYSLFYIPGKSPDNLGHDIGIPENELDRVVHFEESCVHPDYRGKKLLSVLMSFLTQIAIKQHNIKHICATVSPYNYPSLKAVFQSSGMLARKLVTKYGGRKRYIFHRNLELFPVPENKKVKVLSKDLDLQQKLFNQGYVAYNVVKGDKNSTEKIFHILFDKFQWVTSQV